VERFVAGDIVVVRFPFSDLSSKKLRPAIIVAIAEYNDPILLHITSNPYSSKNTVSLEVKDFLEGSLPQKSFIRIDKIFTLSSKLLIYKAGTVNKRKKPKRSRN